jgi:Spy/CpxP family protein refolding chaperone
MTNTSRRVGFILGAAVLMAAAGIGARAQNSSPSIAAQRGPGGPRARLGRGGPMGPGGAADLPLAQLNLTPQQRGTVKSIMDSHQDELKALGDREMAARGALEAAISADAIDEGAIRARVADVASVETDMALTRAHVRAEVFQVLTPDQQKQAKALAAAPRPRGRGAR